ncbi:unnamed protein product, partial [Staurois parvus]
WIDKSEEYGKCLGIHVISVNESQIEISLKKNPSLFDRKSSWSCEFQKKNTGEVLCKGTANQQSLDCFCVFSTVKSSDGDVMTAKAESTNIEILEDFQFRNCSQYTESSCLECISNGCLFCTRESECRSPLTPCADTADETECKTIENTAAIGPSCSVKIKSVYPNRITYAGKRNVLITGENLRNLTKLFLVGTSSCKPQEVQIRKEEQWNDTHAFISLPIAKEVKQLCVQCEGKCQQGLNIFYESLPTCSVNDPNVVWL